MKNKKKWDTKSLEWIHKVREEMDREIREIGNQHGTASALSKLAEIAYGLREYKESKRVCQQGLEIFREIRDRSGIGFSLTILGIIVHEIGDYAEAKEYLQEAVSLNKEIVSHQCMVFSLANLGIATCSMGDYEEARQYLHEALKTGKEIGIVPMVLEALVGMARIKNCRLVDAKAGIEANIEDG